MDMRKRLSLRKEQVAVSLRKHGALGVRARVVLVLDASGSMSGLYFKGVVADVVERMVAVAAELDDDGVMQAWTFASHAARLPDLSPGELPEWLELHVRVGELTLFRRSRKARKGLRPGQVDMRAVGIQNEEQKVIAEVRTYVREHPAADPTLVLFFSDGGVYRNKEIEQELREAVEEPVFWQFVGLGRSNYGVLERFDQLPGRRVDNVGFFAVDDIAGLPDPELYDRLLSQFPAWVTAARRAGHHLRPRGCPRVPCGDVRTPRCAQCAAWDVQQPVSACAQRAAWGRSRGGRPDAGDAPRGSQRSATGCGPTPMRRGPGSRHVTVPDRRPVGRHSGWCSGPPKSGLEKSGLE